MSGGLDEHDVAALLAAGAPIDGFGIGTRLDVSADAPSLEMVYKLVSFGGRDMLKLSPEKETWVGAKQVVRRHGADGRLAGDTLGLASEDVPADAEALLEPVMRDGRAAWASTRRSRRCESTARGSSPRCRRGCGGCGSRRVIR